MADDRGNILDIEKQDQMADVQQNSPSAIRENLVATAVTFLQNPKVRQSAFAQRKAFLERKGLRADEIALAIQRSGTADDENAVPPPPPMNGNSAVVPVKPVPPDYVLPHVSVWTRVREIMSSTLLLTGAAYGLYHFYRVYLAPVLFGKKPRQEEAFDRLSKSIDDLQKSMTDVVANIIELQRQLTNSNDQVLSVIRSSSALKGSIDPGLINVSDLRDEIKSVKSLLLSRNQFPPTPAVAPVIPTWQLQRSGPETAKSAEQTASTTENAQPVEVTNDNLEKQNDSDDSQSSCKPNGNVGLQLAKANKDNNELSEEDSSEQNGEIQVTTSSEDQTTKSASVINGGMIHDGDV